MTLEKQIDRLLKKKVDHKKFKKVNQEYVPLVYQTLLEIAKKVPELDFTKLNVGTDAIYGGGGYDINSNSFELNIGDFIYSENDVIWLVYHEIGHFYDHQMGFLHHATDADGNEYFIWNKMITAWEEISFHLKKLARTRCLETTKEWARKYALLPLEASANRFAAKYCPKLPDEITFVIAREVGLNT